MILEWIKNKKSIMLGLIKIRKIKTWRNQIKKHQIREYEFPNEFWKIGIGKWN